MIIMISIMAMVALCYISIRFTQGVNTLGARRVIKVAMIVMLSYLRTINYFLINIRDFLKYKCTYIIIGI